MIPLTEAQQKAKNERKVGLLDTVATCTDINIRGKAIVELMVEHGLKINEIRKATDATYTLIQLEDIQQTLSKIAKSPQTQVTISTEPIVTAVRESTNTILDAIKHIPQPVVPETPVIPAPILQHECPKLPEFPAIPEPIDVRPQLVEIMSEIEDLHHRIAQIPAPVMPKPVPPIDPTPVINKAIEDAVVKILQQQAASLNVLVGMLTPKKPLTFWEKVINFIRSR